MLKCSLDFDVFLLNVKCKLFERLNQTSILPININHNQLKINTLINLISTETTEKEGSVFRFSHSSALLLHTVIFNIVSVIYTEITSYFQNIQKVQTSTLRFH